MSHVLTVTTTARFHPAKLDLEDVRWDPDGDGFRLWRQGVGARVIQVEREGAELRVRIPILASAADVQLAVAVATGFGVPVHVEGRGLLEPAEVVAFHAGDWWRGPAESAVDAFRRMVRDGQGPLTVPGPVRPLVVGPRVLDGLDPADPGGALVERLRSIQWDLPPGVYDAEASLLNDGAEPRVRMVLWINDGDVVLADADYVMVAPIEDESDVRAVRWDRIGELAGEAGTLLDERQWLIRRVDDATWAEIRAKAATLSADDELRALRPSAAQGSPWVPLVGIGAFALALLILKLMTTR